MLWTGIANAQQSGIESAQQAFEQQRWELVTQLLAAQPQTPETIRLLALAWYHQQQLDQAVPLLRQAHQANPADTQVTRALLDSLVARQDFGAAKQVLARLPANSNSNFTRLTRARIAVAEGDSATAEVLYGQLLDADNVSTAQLAADEYAQFLLQQQRNDEAYRVAQQGLRRDPDSFTGNRLASITPVTEPAAASQSLDVNVGYRFEYDDNLALLPDALAQASGLDQDDFRHVVTADLNYQQAFGSWTLFGEARGSQSIHHQASDFDFTFLNALLGAGQNFSGWGWRLPVELTHNRFGGDAFNTDVTATPGVYFKLSDSLLVHTYGRYADRDFDQVAFAEDDRSGDELAGGMLLAGNIFPRLGVRSFVEYVDYDADGSNWERQEINAYAYLEYSLLQNFQVGAGARYSDIDFANINVPFLIERDDQDWQYFASLGYSFTGGWQLRGQVTVVDHQSNIPVFEYDRLVVSLGLSKRF